VTDSARTIVNIFGSDIDTYLSTRASQGFNSVQIYLVANTYVNAVTPYAAKISGGPLFAFTNNGPITSSWVVNSTYWTLIDTYVAKCLRYGLVAILSPYESHFKPGDATGGAELVAAGNTACFKFGLFIGDRYKNLPHIIWQLGNDTEILNTNIYDAMTSLIQRIQSVDPHHLMTVEIQNNESPLNTTFTPSINGTFNRLGINGIYTWAVVYGECMVGYNGSRTSFAGVAGTNNTSPAPTILLEASYEGENNNGNGSSTITYRKQIWWVALSGCFRYIFGNHFVRDFGSGWQSNLATPGASDVITWATFFAGISWQTPIPDQIHVIGTSGFGTPSVSATGTSYQNDNYVCVGADNLAGSATLACAYFSLGSRQTLTVALSNFASMITAQWVDPTSGAKTSVSGSPFTNMGTHNFSPTGRNAAGDADWVLLLTA
jgi:hypothetical protein